MIPIFVDGPAVEPVSLPEMKAHLRLDDDGQDDLVSGLVRAARLMVEAASRRLLIEQGWRIVMDRWPRGGRVLLPLSPVLAVDGVRVRDAAGGATEIELASIELDAASDPPCLVVSGAPSRERRETASRSRSAPAMGTLPKRSPSP